MEFCIFYIIIINIRQVRSYIVFFLYFLFTMSNIVKYSETINIKGTNNT